MLQNRYKVQEMLGMRGQKAAHVHNVIFADTFSFPALLRPTSLQVRGPNGFLAGGGGSIPLAEFRSSQADKRFELWTAFLLTRFILFVLSSSPPKDRWPLLLGRQNYLKALLQAATASELTESNSAVPATLSIRESAPSG